MNMSKKTTDALNKQMNLEFESAYLYLAMAAWFEKNNLPGMASWMKKQMEEEQEHGMKIFNYLYERGSEAKLDVIPKPKATWKSPIAVFEDSLKHEQLVSKSILDVLSVAEKERDKPTHIFLHWYVEEQVEEEASVTEIIDKLKMVGENKMGVYMLDKELGQRGS